MQEERYTYDKSYSTRYSFISKGNKGAIEKIVEFTATSVEGIFNIGFGDILANGNVDDSVNSNNGDIIKVLATVIAIIEDFANEHPGIKIVFTGSTKSRTQLYQRILKMYYKEFEKKFNITALIEREKESYSEVLFNPSSDNKYAAFFVKRK